jgi:hypothetical protein
MLTVYLFLSATYRLAYHFGKVQGKRSDAFKYTVKAADQAIKRGAMTDGLTAVQNASKMAIARTEYRVLINVVDRALDELQAMGFSDENSSPKFEAYKGLKASLGEALEALANGQPNNSRTSVIPVPESTVLVPGERLGGGGGELHEEPTSPRSRLGSLNNAAPNFESSTKLPGLKKPEKGFCSIS